MSRGKRHAPPFSASEATRTALINEMYRLRDERTRLRTALCDLLDTVERGDEFLVTERVAAARAALAGWGAVES
jgi:hypothetical protein